MIKSVAWLALSSLIGYFVVLLTSPILTRLYTPSDFGLFGIYNSILAITSIIATMSFEFGILNSKRKTQALYFSYLSTISAFIFIMISLTVSFLYYLIVSAYDINPLIYVLAFIGCFFAIMSNISINWEIYNKNYKIVAASTITSLVGRSFFQVIFGFLFGGIFNLISGDILGRFFGWIIVKTGLLKSSIKSFKKNHKFHLKNVKKNLNYVIFLTPANAIETALAWLPASLFAIYYDPYTGGLLALVQRLAAVPLTIINQSLGHIFHRYASNLKNGDNYKLLRIIFFVIFFSLPLFILVIFILYKYGSIISSFIFGNDWKELGNVFLIFLPLHYLFFLSLISNRIILAINKLHIKFTASLVHLLLIIIIFPIAKFNNLSSENAMILMSLMLFFSHLIFFIYVLWLISKLSKISFNK